MDAGLTIGLGLIGILGTGGAYYRYRYKSAGDPGNANRLVILDDVLIDITMALLSTSSGEAVPVDMIFARPVNQENKHVKLTGTDGGANVSAFKNLRVLQKEFAKKPPETSGYRPPTTSKIALDEFFRAYVGLVAKIHNMEHSLFDKVFHGRCSLPNISGTENLGGRGAKQTVVNSLLVNTVQIFSNVLNSNKADQKIPQDVLLELTRNIKSLMFLSACFFHNITDPASYLRQPYTKLSSKSSQEMVKKAKTKAYQSYHSLARNRDHPFHLQTRLASTYDRVLIGRMIGANKNTSKALLSVCFPQMVELFRLSMDYILAIRANTANKQDEKAEIARARAFLKTLRSNSKPDPGSESEIRALGQLLIQSVKEVETTKKKTEQNVLLEYKAAISNRMNNIAKEIASLADEYGFQKFTLGDQELTVKDGQVEKGEGTTFKGKLPTKIVYSTLTPEGKGKARVTVERTEEENGETKNKMKKIYGETLKGKINLNLPLQLLTQDQMKQMKDTRGDVKAVTDTPIPEELLGFVERISESPDCRILQIILERQANNKTRRYASERFLACFREGQEQQKMRLAILEVIGDYILQLDEYRRTNRNLGVSRASGSGSFNAGNKDLYDEKMAVMSLAIRFLRPMLIVIANPSCYFSQKDKSSVKELVEKAFKNPVYKDFSPAGLGAVVPTNQAMKAVSLLKNENMKQLRADMGMSDLIRVEFDQLFRIRAVSENTKDTPYPALMSEDFNARSEAGYVKYTGYGRPGNPLNTFIYMQHMNGVATLCRYVNQFEGYFMYVKTGSRQSSHNLYRACKTGYKQTLTNFYKKRNEFVKTESNKQRKEIIESANKAKGSRIWRFMTRSMSGPILTKLTAAYVAGPTAVSFLGFVTNIFRSVAGGLFAGGLTGVGTGAAVATVTAAVGSLYTYMMGHFPKAFKTYKEHGVMAATSFALSALGDDVAYFFFDKDDVTSKNVKAFVEEEVTDFDLQKARFAGFQLSSESKNNSERLQKELLGEYTKKLRPGVYIRSSHTLPGRNSYIHGICTITGWHVPVLICGTAVEDLQQDMNELQKDWLLLVQPLNA